MAQTSSLTIPDRLLPWRVARRRVRQLRDDVAVLGSAVRSIGSPGTSGAPIIESEESFEAAVERLGWTDAALATRARTLCQAATLMLGVSVALGVYTAWLALSAVDGIGLLSAAGAAVLTVLLACRGLKAGWQHRQLRERRWIRFQDYLKEWRDIVPSG
ncbi:hypothetical protein EAH89_25490 [Roseomonas nepalensis]|uniref:Uncharacterized protein n=1 Tax=Muricoccus nepalensis TaxID=1854500 RepID=A0A502F9E3_9PROT|nr:hypothetical protein [Roseomonas nepalensis]TPG45979.1 hypothetical protein EAH89_25490 [Roseomonas nepalensis]